MLDVSSEKLTSTAPMLQPFWFDGEQRHLMNEEERQFALGLRSVLTQRRADASAPNKLVRATLRVARRGGMKPAYFEKLMAARCKDPGLMGKGHNGSLWAHYMRGGPRARMSVDTLRSLVVTMADEGWLQATRPEPPWPHPAEVGWGPARQRLPESWAMAWHQFERPTFLHLLRLRLYGIQAAALCIQAGCASPTFDQMLDSLTEYEVKRKLRVRPEDRRKFGQSMRSNRSKHDALWWVSMIPPRVARA